ncbi:MAG: thiosulfate/3-mercaptopyruvate sulfurtransferase [Gammaproteobacteria bacterium]|nr:thiosulfate/3-mercaptopyruvate sulfurtransferase [Gammaproteobacteria bacterium]
MPFTTLIDVDSLAGLAGPVVLLDCRFDLNDPGAGRRAYAEGHIPGAHYVDLNQDLSSPVTSTSGRHPLPAPDALAAYFAAAGIRGETQVIAYDEANGSFAARAWWLLGWLGKAPVAVLDGGFKAWVAAGGAAAGAPVETGEPKPAHGGAQPAFTVRLRPETVLTATDVLRALEDPRRLLVDARAAERFAGAVEPLDPVAGHIPGAVNHPFTGNLGEDGRFLPAAELRRRWLDRLRGTEPADAILMCGSGVTACHNILAMASAGLPGGKLYAGSWSEWIRDPERPVARGA